MFRPRFVPFALAPFLTSLMLPSLAAAQDPFTSSERWLAGPGASAWMPEQVAFAGDDAFVWTAVRGAQNALLLFDSVSSAASTARGVAAPLSGAFGVPLVAAGSRGDAVFALQQVQAPTVFSRAPLVTAYDPRTASGGGALTELWTHDMGVRINGPVRLEADAQGSLVAAAAWDSATGLVRVDLLDGTTGALLGRADLAAVGLSAIAVSGDGSRVAVSAGTALYVLDASAAILHSQAISAATSALSLSNNGGVLAHGEFGGVQVLVEQPGGGHVPLLRVNGPQVEIPSRIAVAGDGGMVAIGWWEYTTGRSARLEMFDLIFQFSLTQVDLTASAGATQNLVSAVRITHDGRRAAFGMWGNGQDAEVFVLDVTSPAPALVVDTPGSVRGLDLDASGTRVAIAHKDVHSSAFGSRGTVRLVDTGERKLQLLDTPRLGNSLVAAARRPGSFGGWFLVGPRNDVPQYFSSVTGPLLLDRGRLQFHARTADANGRIDFVLPIPNVPVLRGMQLHVQAAFRTPQGLEFTENLVSPFLLD